MRKKPRCKCGKEYEISFEGDGVQYPVFCCPEHGIEKNEWKIWWEKYSDRGLKSEYWENKIDRPACVVSYFIFYYNKFYESDYTLDYSNPIPYKNKDFTMARRLLAMFGENFLFIKNYIKWVFKFKVRSKKYSVTSLGFLVSPSFVNEYNLARSRSLKPTRSTDLPKDFLNWCVERFPETIKNYELSCYNDLNILVCTAQKEEDYFVIEEARKRGILPESGMNNLEE